MQQFYNCRASQQWRIHHGKAECNQKYSDTPFMRVEEVAEEFGIFKSYVYKIVQKLNTELKSQDFLMISGRINKQYFFERVCCGSNKEEKTNTWRVLYRYTD